VTPNHARSAQAGNSSGNNRAGRYTQPAVGWEALNGETKRTALVRGTPLKKEIEDAFAQVFRAREEAERIANQKRQDGPEADAPLESVSEQWIPKIVLSLPTPQ
jgi:hypothetical protein